MCVFLSVCLCICDVRLGDMTDYLMKWVGKQRLKELDATFRSTCIFMNGILFPA